jgi:adenylate cyclase
MRASPIFPLYTDGRSTQIMLADEAARSRYPIGADLWAEGYTQYDALALRFSDDTFKALTVATRNEGGFGDSLVLVEETLAALALVFEGFVARNTAQTLMETYVGKRAGLRVLDGEIARGDGSHIKAVIWFSDLRDFTRLSQAMDETQLLSILNGYFALVTNAIEENHGEVLKFIGDAMLAIFPHEGEVELAVARAEAAAFDALDKHRESEVSAVSFGIGLHPGEVFYGNIGGGTRLDFTVIGEAVNIASRITGLAGMLNEKLLVSEVLAGHSKRDWMSVGSHELKGVAEPMQVFVPAF